MMMCYALLVMSMLSLLMVIGGVVVLYRILPQRAAPGISTALDILADRFSRGEIDQADYQARRQVLEETG